MAVTAGIWVVVPAKPFAEAKSRMSTELNQEDRSALARRLLRRTLTTLQEVQGIAGTLVVSRDPEALAIAVELGAEALAEQGDGLNPALTFAAEHVTGRGGTGVLVLPADLPVLSPADVQAILGATGTAANAVVIAPDRHHSGTNALLLQPPTVIPFAFGRDSFHAHVALARQVGIEPEVVERTGFGLDVDYPGDLQEADEMSEGAGAS